MNHKIKKQGFTIIELMLAMSFVSLLLVAVAMTVIQISNIYNRGIILKDVNQAGRALVSELQQSITQTSAFDVNVSAGSSTANYVIQSDVGGRLCTGRYSYVWNYAKAIKSNASRNKYDGLTPPEIYFIKIFDPTLQYCTAVSGNLPDIKADTGATELFSDSQHNLALHSFKVTSNASDAKTNQRLYNIEFILGTSDTGAINTTLNTCKVPSESGSDLTYCSINQFNITVRSNNAID